MTWHIGVSGRKGKKPLGTIELAGGMAGLGLLMNL